MSSKLLDADVDMVAEVLECDDIESGIIDAAIPESFYLNKTLTQNMFHIILSNMPCMCNIFDLSWHGLESSKLPEGTHVV